jgi:2-succinyl-6-hydroxy-2,4-cyclohexadiene-1-carboxylate synthase
MARVVVNGVRFNVARAGAGPALVLLHGFTGGATTWEPHVPVFARDFDTVAIDLLGHGASAVPAEPARYRVEHAVADLTGLLDRLGIARAAWLGYSMGGRVALRVAIARPAKVAALVLEGAAPGIADPAERAARIRSDEALAIFVEREGMAAFVDRWERLPLFATQARLPVAARASLRRQRLANDPVGLANSLRGLGQGAQEPLHDKLGNVEVPTLLVVGEEDAKFRCLAAEMSSAMPMARVAIVARAGHAPHLEQPDAFQRVVLDFLRSLDWSYVTRE